MSHRTTEREGRTVDVPTYPIETLRATWTMRTAFRSSTDAEFADMLSTLGVPNANEQVKAARHWAYGIERGQAAK